MPELNKIKRSMHANVISSFWMMLQMIEANAEDALTRHQVEGFYRQWNTMTGDNKVPRWKRQSSEDPAHENDMRQLRREQLRKDVEDLWSVDDEGDERLFTHDHIIARSLNGKDDITNTQTMCSPCNAEKSIAEREQLER